MRPWFLKEGKVVPFPKKEKTVVSMPNVASYPNFLAGVEDLQSRVKQGTLSDEMYKRLYTDLLHRFMRRESAETPWFMVEAPADQGIMSLPQANDLKSQVEKAIAQLDISNKDNIELLKKMYGVLRTSGIENRMKSIFSKDNDNRGTVLQAMGRSFLEIANQYPEQANEFLNQFEKNPNVVNVELLTNNPGQIKSTESLFVGDFAKKFGLELVKIRGEGYKKSGFAGPGEVALACLSNKIRLGEGDVGGDIIIGKKAYEVKGNEGRLFDKGQVTFSNTKSYLTKTNMAGNINLNLSVEDLARLDPELGDIEPASDLPAADKLRQGTGKQGQITSDQANWIDKDPRWYKGLIKSIVTDWYGTEWAKYSDELFERMGTGNGFKELWLQLQFASYKERAQHNGIILLGLNRFVLAEKGLDLTKNIDNWGKIYQATASQARELSIQLKI